MKNKRQRQETTSPLLDWVYFHVFFFMLSYYSPVRLSIEHSSAGKYSDTAELWRWGAVAHLFQETGDRITGVLLRTMPSPKPLAGSRNTTCAWVNPAASLSPQLGQRSLRTDFAVTWAEPLVPRNQGTQNLLDAPCLPSPKYQADVWLAASRACNHKIRKKQKWNATLVCLLWSDAGLIPKIRIGFWSWQSRTCSKESTPPSKRYPDIFIPPANLTISQEVGGWPDTYSPTIKGATRPGEPPWRSFPSLLSCLHFSSSSM